MRTSVFTLCRYNCDALCNYTVLFYITHRNYNDVMYTLWFPPTYGPLARRTTRVWAVFQSSAVHEESESGTETTTGLSTGWRMQTESAHVSTRSE